MKLTIKLVKGKWQVRKGNKVLHECLSESFAKESAEIWSRSPDKLKSDALDLRKAFEDAIRKFKLDAEQELSLWEKDAMKRQSIVSKGKKVPKKMVRLFDRVPTLLSLTIISERKLVKGRKI